MRKLFTLAALCLSTLCTNAQDESGYTIRTLTFEDADFKGDNPTFGGEKSWSSLIDEPQYGGTLLYGSVDDSGVRSGLLLLTLKPMATPIRSSLFIRRAMIRVLCAQVVDTMALTTSLFILVM